MELRKKRRSEETSTINKENTTRIKILVLTIITMIALLVVRLAYIQLYKGDELSQRALNQRIKEIPINSQRGTIFDRNMIPLTDRESFNYLYIFPEYFPETEESVLLVREVTDISNEEFNIKKQGTRPFALKVKNSKDEILKKIQRIRGVFPIVSEQRYSDSGLATHVIGYTNKIDNTGENGLEKTYDKILKENQQSIVGAIVDANKKLIPGLEYKTLDENQEQKYNIVSTLDINIQKIVEEELNTTGKNGSIVVIDSTSGEVLAMASTPKYNPDNLVENLNSNNKELFNRAIQITYPPGSIFKIVVLAAALEEGIVPLDHNFFCQGYEEIGDIQIKCSSYKRGGHGEINLEDAFSLSCNSVFIQLGQILGGEKIIQMANSLGLGSLTGIELSEEVSGQLPTVDYTRGAGIGNISIGQGTLEVTPLQIAKMTSTIANDGVDFGVSLVKKIVDDKERILEIPLKEKPKPIISMTTAKQIQEMMKKVVQSGTGRRIDLATFGGAAGKTGSAEARINGKDAVHAWFTGYFPEKNPEYIVTILLENGGSGGAMAAPVFNKIAERIILESKND